MDSLLSDMKDYMLDQIKVKLYDSNTAIHRKHVGTRRSLSIGGCHKIIFSSLFGSQSTVLNFKTVESVRCSIPNVVLGKINGRSRDTSIAGPIASLVRDYDVFPKGTLLLPLSEQDEMYKCFVSSSGPSAERDDIPHWVTPVNSEELTNFDLGKCPKLEQTVVASETKLDFFTCSSGYVEEGDTVFFHGESAKVYAVSESFNNPANSTIRVRRDFLRQHKAQSVKIFRPPRLEGVVKAFPSAYVNVHMPFQVKLNSRSKEGDLEVIYKNLIYNELGYLTHDSVLAG